MKFFKRFLSTFFFCSFFYNLSAQNVVFTKQANAFPLVSGGSAATIYYDTADARVVSIAAQLFSNDVRLVSEVTPVVDSSFNLKAYSVIVGSIGKSNLVDRLVKSGKLKVNGIVGKWESYVFAVIDNPVAGCKQALVIAGSDERGTAFGIFELSKMIGVSPFYWWADINPNQREEIYVTKGVRVAAPPSVKYRGIFINDEDWGLQPWAAKTYEPETGDIGPKTYAKVFELLLRLKANMIWPAMHPSTKPFYYYPGNKQVAADYSIVIGSSHAEPMLRNNVGEWDKATMGDFNYLTNPDKVQEYWEARVKESSINDAIYTLGMRGIHDSGLEGIKDPKDAVPLLERIFEDQRSMIRKYINKDVTKVPQVFTAYKEVLDIYDKGLKVPDDVTIVWPDDNYGYIQRLNDEKEKKRKGGSGVYYHASYWGRPHDYLWLSTTHPSLVREEMMKAYEAKADRIWVLNVGDIKPLEYTIIQFFDMAYNVKPFKDPKYTYQHLMDWTTSIFGKLTGTFAGDLLWSYYWLAFERRPEFMGWSQTEPTTKTNYTSYNHYSYGDEAQKRITRYGLLEKAAKAYRSQALPKDSNAFYQLIYYPVVCAALMNKKFLYRDKSYIYSKQKRYSASYYATLANKAYDDIVKETDYYNTKLSGGKWNHIMSMEPRKLPVYQKPVIGDIIMPEGDGWGIAPEGYDSVAADQQQPFKLPVFHVVHKQRFFIDIFLTGNKKVNWAAVENNVFRLSKTSGTLVPNGDSSQVRVWVYVNWDRALLPMNQRGEITISGGGKQYVVQVENIEIADPALYNYKGFIADNGVISIYANNYSKNMSGNWKVIDGLPGKSLQAVQPLPIVKDPIKKSNSFVSYDFYTFNASTPILNVYTLPTHPLNKNYSMRYGVSIDDGPMQVVDFRTYGRSEEWKQNVLRNNAIMKVTMPPIKSGKHILQLYAIDPGVILERIVIDLGGLKSPYSFLEESKSGQYYPGEIHQLLEQ
jgi:hypothetical protein